ncbi:acyl-CoA thioesterase [Roseibium sp.]|uniref:acyl-CoA thioesterase n=1 Tax=Roseibium sp. TaxID=1936156 RepID=UPI003263A1B4
MASVDPAGHLKQASKPSFTYHHTVSFKDTNVVGNVYYTNHLEWQGRCREHFLRSHAPGILDDLSKDLRIVTLRCSCDYFAELHAFDDVEVVMSLDARDGHRISLSFEYLLEGRQIAQGHQQLGFMRMTPSGALEPTDPPPEMIDALSRFSHQAGPAQGGQNAC